MVTWGWYETSRMAIDNTEIFNVCDNVWRTVAKLPFPMDRMRVATVNNRVLSFGISNIYFMEKIKCISSGGLDNRNRNQEEILEFNLQTESWAVIGEMKQPIEHDAVSIVSSDDYEKWCTLG